MAGNPNIGTGAINLALPITQEASNELDSPITLDVMQPLQAYDAGGRARSVSAIVQALAFSKETGVDADQALALVNWAED